MALLRRCDRFFRLYLKFGTAYRVEAPNRSSSRDFIGRTVYLASPQRFSREASNLSRYDTSLAERSSVDDFSTLHVRRSSTLSSAAVFRKVLRFENLSNIAESYANGERAASEENLLTVLSCCGEMLPDAKPQQRQELAARIWDLMESRGFRATLDHYHAMLAIAAQNGHRIESTEFLESMSAEPNSRTYELLLEICAKLGDVEGARAILGTMEKAGYPVNERVLNALVECYSVLGQTRDSLATIETMKVAGVEPSSETYANLALGYSKAGNVEELTKILESRKLSERQLLKIIKFASENNEESHVPLVAKFLPEVPNRNSPHFVSLVVELIHRGRTKDAYELMNRAMPPVVPEKTALIVDDSGNPEYVRYTDYLLDEMFRAATPTETILEVAEDLTASGKNPRALYKVTETALRLGNEEFALTLFERMKARGMAVRAHFYWPLILRGCEKEGEKKLFDLMDHMKRLEIKFDYDTMRHYIVEHVSLEDPKLMLRKLQDHGATLAEATTPLLEILLDKGQLKAVVALCKKIATRLEYDKLLKPLLRSYHLTKDADNVAVMLKMNINGDYAGKFLLKLFRDELNPSDVENLLAAFKKHRLELSATVADMLQHVVAKKDESAKAALLGFGEIVNPNFHVAASEIFPTQSWPHPRDMTKEQLKSHLLALRRHNKNTRGALRKLLLLCNKSNDIECAQEMVKEFNDEHFEWTPGMKSTLFAMYARNDMLKEAANMLDELRNEHPEFLVDKFKLLEFATSLVKKENDLETAIKILQEHGTHNGVSDVSKNCHQFLDAVARSSKAEETERVLYFLRDRGYCQINNALLGPLVRQHLVKGDLVAAVKTFKKCVGVYRQAPLLQELLIALVEKSADPEYEKLLKEVFDIASDIHNHLQPLCDLLIALAKCNHVDKLHRIIKQYGIDQEYLVNRLTFLPNKFQLPVLKVLLETSKGIPNQDVTFLYELILSCYVRLGDCEGAIALWRAMQDDEVKPSNDFKTKFVALLNSNKIPLSVVTEKKLEGKREIS